MAKRRTTEQNRMENTMAKPLANPDLPESRGSYMATRSSHEPARIATRSARLQRCSTAGRLQAGVSEWK